MPPNPQTARVLYATDTGTAEDVAYALTARLSQCGVRIAGCEAVDEYDRSRLVSDGEGGCLFVFVVATCGDGEVPGGSGGMLGLWRVLRDVRLGHEVLSGVRCAVFGLGDRGYAKFNAAGRMLAVRLGDLGAKLVVPIGLGDESEAGGYDAALGPWIEALCGVLVPGYVTGMFPEPPPPVPRLVVELQAPSVGPTEDAGARARAADMWGVGQARRRVRGKPASVVDAVVIENTVLTNPEELDDDREVRHVRLDVLEAPKSAGFRSYAPGDIVHVMAKNRASAVEAFFQLTDLNGSTTISVRRNEECVGLRGVEVNIETPCSLADFVAAQLDLSATPRRRFLERLAPFASDGMQREKLLELSSAAGADDLTQYAYREKRTILMALRDFPSARPPIADLIDMIPRLRSRAFSIASSASAHPGQIHICAAMVRYTTPLRFARIGVCSAHFLRLGHRDIVPVFLETGSALRFRRDAPAILIGTGTGVAPMRSFLSTLKESRKEPLTTRLLYFGCRSPRGDFLYAHEWPAYESSGVLSRTRTAFSRITPEKIYVQDRLLEDGVDIWELLQTANATVYLAGVAGNMPKDVRAALHTIAMTHGKLSSAAATTYLKSLETARRLQMECW